MNINQLWNQIQELRESSTPPSKEDIQTISDTLAQIQVARGESGALSDFFKAVGEAYVGAQEELDLTSKDYSNRNPKQPALFRIPKVSASFSFMASSVKGSGFNVFFASSKNQREQHQEQEVSFEVVAVPPPPEALRELQSQPLQFFVLNRSDRERTLAKILSEKPDWGAVYGEFLLFERRQGRLAALLRLGATGQVKKLAIVGLNADSEPVTSYTWSANQTINLAPVADFLAGLLEIQRALLGEAG